MSVKTVPLPLRGTFLDEREAMGLSLELARLGVRGANPLVGAVIIDASGRFLTAGWHRGAGTAHAEVDAIARAYRDGLELSGAHMFVTLEPCNHQGRTGPCSHALSESGIEKVTFAVADQTKQAHGGAAYLEQRGVKAQSGLLAEEATSLNRQWFLAQQQHRPWVSLKIASTLDGYIAATDGSSQWITSEEARQDGHLLRSRAQAILVGTQTVIDDNPRLTARGSAGNLLSTQPLRVMMGERELAKTLAPFANENYLHLKTRDPHVVLQSLHAQNISHLLIEGGPTVASAFLKAGLVDEIFWYQAPLLLGNGKKALSDLGVSTLNDAETWELDHLGMEPAIQQLGADLRLHLSPRAT